MKNLFYTSPKYLQNLKGLDSSASEIDGSVNLAHPSLNSFLNQINQNERHIAIFVNSDSTGNATIEWVYYFAEWLALKYPEYTVRYRIWNDTNNNYDSPININNGIGTYNIDIWNFAVSGSSTFHCLNVNRRKSAIIDIIDTTIYPTSSNIVDLTIINHGHNVWNSTKKWNDSLKHAQFTEEYINIHPFSSWLWIKQNPYRDNYDNKSRIEASVDWANTKNICIADAWSKFEALNKNGSLYSDNIHPSPLLGTEENPTGTRLFLNAVTEQISKKSRLNMYSPFSILNNTSKSININPYLTHSNDSLPPDGYTVVGGTAIKDNTSYIDDNKGYSTKITATGGTPCYLRWSVFGDALTNKKDKLFTVAIRLKGRDEGSNTNYQRVAFVTSSDTLAESAQIPLNGVWHWRFYTIRVKSTDSYFRVQVYVDTSTSVTANDFINIDRIIIVEGKMPYGASI